MESVEKDVLIEKLIQMPPEQVEKVMIFIAGLEAGERIVENGEGGEDMYGQN